MFTQYLYILLGFKAKIFKKFSQTTSIFVFLAGTRNYIQSKKKFKKFQKYVKKRQIYLSYI